MTDNQVCSKCGSPLPSNSRSGSCPKCLMQMGFDSVQETDPAEGKAVKPFADPLSAARLGHLFPELEIIEEIGRGGMGVVYRAKQKHLDRFVALKVLRPDLSSDPAFAERFTREARALAKLNHPTIISVFDFGQREDCYFLTMEFIEGANLRLLSQTNPLSPEQALEIVPQICDALQYAHDQGVVHRDIKPENILLDTRGKVKIADFGLAKLMRTTADDFTLTGTRQVVGTPHYMAPEQMEKPQQVDHRADIYSLGVVIYEMLTGELPLGRFAPPSEKVQVDVKLDEVVLRTLAKEPELRYQHATDIKSQVEEISGYHHAAIAGSPAYDRLQSSLRMAAVLLIVVGCIDVFFTVVFFAFSMDTDDAVPFFFMHAPMALIITWGAVKFFRFKSYTWALVAAICAILPTHIGAFLGLPVGIWTIMMLGRTETHSMFHAPHKRRRKVTHPTDARSQVADIEKLIQQRAELARAVAEETGRAMRPFAIRFASFISRCILWVVRLPFRIPWRSFLSLGISCGVWTIVGIAVAIGFWQPLEEIAPSTYRIYDHTGNELRPKSGAYHSLSIRAYGRGNTIGTNPPPEIFQRQTVVFTLTQQQYRPGQRLEVDLTGQPPIASSYTGQPRQYWPYFDPELTFREWLESCGVDIASDAVKDEINNLNQVVSLLSVDGGIENSPRPRIRLIADMIDKSLFDISGRRYIDNRARTDEWVVVAYVSVAALVILTGNVLISRFVVKSLRRRGEAKV